MKYNAITKTFQNLIYFYIPKSEDEYGDVIYGQLYTEEIFDKNDEFFDFADDGEIKIFNDCVTEMTLMLLENKEAFIEEYDRFFEQEFKSDYISELTLNERFFKLMFNQVKDDLDGFKEV